MIELGGSIELAGFNEVDNSEMIVLKKIVGSYARKFSDNLKEDYERLSLTMKPVHTNKFEMHAKLLAKGKLINSEYVDNNFFVCLAEVLKKIETQIEKK